MNDSTTDARKKIHRSGALARVLGEVTEPTGLEPIASKAVDTTLQRSPVKYFPTKGFAKVNAAVCRPWRLADRPSDEFGHVEALGRSLKANGQVQPALVKVCDDPTAPEIKYEVIAGVARWRSALAAGIELEVQIRTLTDVEAYRAMIAENEDRQNLSDYARSVRFAKALSEKIVADQDELAGMAGMSKSQMSYFVSFAGLPEAVVKSFSDIKSIPLCNSRCCKKRIPNRGCSGHVSH
jgi:ParB family transcriptional regulator, chromosome partitioning protein